VALYDTPISTVSNGSITAVNCTFSGNSARHAFDNFGGGALSSDKVYLTNCTFWGNTASDTPGGAVYARLGGAMTNCTVVNNTAITGGGVTSRTNEVDGDRTRLHLLNCVIIGNHTAPVGSLHGKSGVNADQAYDRGGNIIGYVHREADADYRDIIYSANGLRAPAEGSVWGLSDAPSDISEWLAYGEPADNGGGVPTIALINTPKSPAVDKGLTLGVSDVGGVTASTAPDTDARGYERDSAPDAGAYEITGIPPSLAAYGFISAQNSVSFSASVMNMPGANGSSVIAAAYGVGGRLLDLKLLEWDGAPINVALNSDGIEKIKIMLWNGLHEIIPLINSYEWNKQD
jgi:hypothetical protein